MEREMITRERLALALRLLRTSRGLTQKDVAARAAAYKDQGFGRLLESQISDFERGRALPSLGSLLNLLAACSESGSQVSFTSLQRAIETVGADGGPPRMPETCAGGDVKAGGVLNTDGVMEMVETILSELSERMFERLRREMQHQQDEMAALRTRVVRTERLLGSLRDPGRRGAGFAGEDLTP